MGTDAGPYRSNGRRTVDDGRVVSSQTAGLPPTFVIEEAGQRDNLRCQPPKKGIETQMKTETEIASNGKSARIRDAVDLVRSETTQLWPEASDDFVLTPQVEEFAERALAYLGAGYPINLAGLAGTGKTTLALHLAAQLGRPVTLLHGDDE